MTQQLIGDDDNGATLKPWILEFRDAASVRKLFHLSPWTKERCGCSLRGLEPPTRLHTFTVWYNMIWTWLKTAPILICPLCGTIVPLIYCKKSSFLSNQLLLFSGVWRASHGHHCSSKMCSYSDVQCALTCFMYAHSPAHIPCRCMQPSVVWVADVQASFSLWWRVRGLLSVTSYFRRIVSLKRHRWACGDGQMDAI